MEKLKQALADAGAFIAKWWGALVSIAVLVFVTMFYRRGKTIDQLKRELEIAKVKQVIDKLAQEANRNEEDYRAKLAHYNELKRKYGMGNNEK